jgi:exosome complex exonuclease RRP6
MTYSGAAFEAVEVTTDVKMADSAASPEVAAVEEIPKSRLWGSVKVTSASALQRTPSSSLFGARSTVAHEESSYSTSQSSLFSTASSHSPPQVSRPTYLHIHVIQTLFQISTPIISSSGKKFLDLVARIHRTLVIAPTTPMVNQTLFETIAQSSVGSTSVTSHSAMLAIVPLDAPDNATIPGQVEIPYIPSNQRQSHFAPVSDDTIVLVGQARQKKRKRTKPKVIDNSSIGDRENSGDDEVFDYATVPNLLDDVKPAPEDLSTRKKKRQKDAKGTCSISSSFFFSKFPLVTSFAASFFFGRIYCMLT